MDFNKQIRSKSLNRDPKNGTDSNHSQKGNRNPVFVKLEQINQNNKIKTSAYSGENRKTGRKIINTQAQLLKIPNSYNFKSQKTNDISEEKLKKAIEDREEIIRMSFITIKDLESQVATLKKVNEDYIFKYQELLNYCQSLQYNNLNNFK